MGALGVMVDQLPLRVTVEVAAQVAMAEFLQSRRIGFHTTEECFVMVEQVDLAPTVWTAR